MDANGQYQYTTQFGISNPSYTGSASTSYFATATATANVTDTTTTTTSSSHVISHTASYPAGNSSAIFPTGSITVPTSLRTTTAGSAPTSSGSTSPPAQTDGAVALGVSFGVVGVAGLVAAIMGF